MVEHVGFLIQSTFHWILSSSIQASLLVGLIVLCKWLLNRRVSVRWHYAIWLLLIIRLIIPWTTESPFSLYNLVPVGSWNQFQGVAEAEWINRGQTETPIYNQSAVLQSPISGLNQLNGAKPCCAGNSLFTLLSMIWATGACGLLGFLLFSYKSMISRVNREPQILDEQVLAVSKKCCEKMKISRPIPLIQSQIVNSPTLIGFWRPKILLPKQVVESFQQQQLLHIFYHELAHAKRMDIAWNSIMYILLILHWFNPILWYAAFAMRRDQEIACDAMALTYMEAAESKSYGYTMIKLLEFQNKTISPIFSAGFTGYKKQLIRRLTMITSFKRNTYSWSVLGLITFLCLATVTLTDAKTALGGESATGQAISLIMPVDGTISTHFGETKGVTTNGIDLVNKQGTPIVAAASGIIIHAEYTSHYGNQIIIQHGDNYQTVYSHLDKIEVQAGESVAQGEVIGLLGSTGRSTGDHLYFELHEEGVPVDPLLFLETNN